MNKTTAKQSGSGKRGMKEYAQNVLIWAFIFWIACLVSLLIDWLLIQVITGFIRGIPLYNAAVMHTVFMGCGAAVVIFGVSYFISYHDAAPRFGQAIADSAGAGVLQLILSVLLGFRTWVSGGVIWLAGIFDYGKELVNIGDLRQISISCALLSFFLFFLVNLAAKLLGSYLGYRKRIRIRIELTGSDQSPCA